MVYALFALCSSDLAAAENQVQVVSPDGCNVLAISVVDDEVYFQVRRKGRSLVNPSRIKPLLENVRLHGNDSTMVEVKRGSLDESLAMPWGKASLAVNRCAYAIVTLSNADDLRWQLELRAYDDGVAFRYRLLEQEGLKQVALRDEATEFRIVGEPTCLFNTLDSFTTSHESLYERKTFSSLPTGKLMDCPLLLVWPNGPSAAITEARVRNFAGMYLQRDDTNVLKCRLSPHPTIKNACVLAETPHESPWRVILLADSAGKLIESNLLWCLNDPPKGDFSWAQPGKTTFHWVFGEFEDDYKLANEREVFVARHRQYIDFCAENKIAYHAISGDGRAWYEQSSTDYGVASEDADLRKPRPELGIPEILDYARQRGVGIRLWVHWQPLSKQLEETLSLYESWGVKGLMVDFLDRDDQEMIEFVDRMLESAARHKIHIQLHGSSKYSGEQRTFPHLFNREGVLNLEYVKWSNFCTPEHSVNVAYTRALAGPVDYHLGGIRCVSRAAFAPRDRAPVVMGTRCHNLALYLVFINPMPMVADAPSSYAGQIGFEFIRDVPTTWDETRFLAGEPGGFIVVARRSGAVWYLGGITNWTAREIELPTDFLDPIEYSAKLWVDGSMDASKPNEINVRETAAHSASRLKIKMATGGGFVAVLQPK